jgi:hypothetical protein
LFVVVKLVVSRVVAQQKNRMDAEHVLPIPLAHTMGSQTQTQQQSQAEPPTPQVQPTCHFRSCPYSKRTWIASPPPLLICLLRGCEKVMHFECYRSFILNKHQIDNPFQDDNDAVCCSKAHLNKGIKQKARDDATNQAGIVNIPWDQDGKEGPADPQNSLAILMDWLTTYGNYKKLKGDNANGATKITIVGQLTRKINSHVRKERTTKSVLSKIDHLIRTYKRASDWANQTGVGVLESQGREPFNQAVSWS